MKRLKWWVIALVGVAALYGTGLDFGRTPPAYAPSAAQRAWLNPAADYHPDEFAYVGLAYRLLVTHSWNPHYFHNPSLNIYTDRLIFGASGAQNLPHNADYGAREIAPFSLYVMGRYLSVLYSLLTVVLTYAAGRAGFDRRVGVAAAVLVALSPLMVQHAHYATPNAQTTMFTTAALLAALVIFRGRYSRRLTVYFVGGLLVGLTMAARYNAVVVGLPVGLAMLADTWRHRRWGVLVIGAAAMPLGFVIGMPGIIFARQEVIDQVRQILDWYRVQGGGHGFTTDRGLPAFYYHWRYLALIGVGPLVIGLALASVGLMLRSRRETAWIIAVLVLYMLVYTILALPGKRLQANLLFPLIAPLALLAGYAAGRIGEHWPARQGRITVGLVGIAVIWPAILAVLLAYRIAATDTRQKAQAWMYAHVPRGATVYLLGPYNVPLDPLDYQTTQTYAREATADTVRQSEAQIIVYSDASPFVTLRDPDLASARSRQRETAIRDLLQQDWIELARFKRMPWPGEDLSPDDISYWHQMEIVIYCNPDNCPVP